MLRLLVVLTSCTAILATPIFWTPKLKQTSVESYEVIPPKLAFLKESFGQSFSKIGDTIALSLKEVFKSIEDRLDSKKFRDSIDDLRVIAEKIFNEDDEIKGDEKTRKIIEQELNKVNEAFGKMLESGVLYMKRRSYRTVDATHFKFAVDVLKKSVIELYS